MIKLIPPETKNIDPGQEILFLSYVEVFYLILLEMDVEKILRNTDFFHEIGDKHLLSLACISIPKKVGKKHTLFLEGQHGHAMFLLVYGMVQLYKSAPDGRDIVIRVIGPGEIFAEVILFEQENFPVSAVALEESLVLMLPRRQIHCLLVDEPFRNAFISMLMRKQRLLTERILNLTLHDVEERFFLFLREQYGHREVYNISLSKKDIAAAIFTNPETFSRLIQRLRHNQTITWQGKKLTLRKGFWENHDEKNR
jgi:CRP/FNR family transcriptional regulator